MRRTPPPGRLRSLRASQTTASASLRSTSAPSCPATASASTPQMAPATTRDPERTRLMTATSDADERRIRRALDERGVAYAPQPPAAPGRERDWLDDVLDAQTETRPPGPPAPPDKPAATDGGEPRWDWQR